MAADWTVQASQAGGYVLLDERGYPQAQGSMATIQRNPQYYRTNRNRPFKEFEGIL